MYENENQQSIRGNARAAGLSGASQALGTGFHSEMPKQAPTPPVHQAMEELEKEIANLRENVNMLVGRLSPVCRPLNALKGHCGAATAEGRPVHCEMEGRIKASSESVSAICDMVASARDALCI